MNIKRARTLQLSFPLGKTVYTATVLLVIVLGTLELWVRQPSVQQQLPVPTLSGDDWMFDIKAETMRRASSTQSFNCLIVGHSATFALVPEIINQEFKSSTGMDLHCFHFGIPSISPYSAAQLTQVLINKYPIQLVIFGTYHLGYEMHTDAVERNPWLQYQTGHYNLQGWALENFYTYRYALRFRQTFTLGYDESNYAQNLIFYGIEHPLHSDGYFDSSINPIKTTREDVDLTKPPDEVLESNFITLYSNYTIYPKQLSALDKFAELKTTHPELEILVLELPFHPSFSLMFPVAISNNSS
jgi:hypothetical protein